MPLLDSVRAATQAGVDGVPSHSAAATFATPALLLYTSGVSFMTVPYYVPVTVLWSPSLPELCRSRCRAVAAAVSVTAVTSIFVLCTHPQPAPHAGVQCEEVHSRFCVAQEVLSMLPSCQHGPCSFFISVASGDVTPNLDALLSYNEQTIALLHPNQPASEASPTTGSEGCASMWLVTARRDQLAGGSPAWVHVELLPTAFSWCSSVRISVRLRLCSSGTSLTNCLPVETVDSLRMATEQQTHFLKSVHPAEVREHWHALV